MKLSDHTILRLKKSLSEDVASGDLTSDLMVDYSSRSQAVIVAKEKGVFCGEAVAKQMAKILDPKLRVTLHIKDGRVFRKGQTLMTLKGRTHILLQLERTLLNLCAHLCGIATTTRMYVDKVKNYKVKILDTRKTTPLWRELEKFAVLCGGGHNHRMGLFDGIFVKENHRKFGNIESLKKVPRRFVIEVRNQKELREALKYRPSVILFDNYTPAKLKEAVKFTRKQDNEVLLEASGGITLLNLSDYAKTGIDQISVGALTHSVKAIDLSMLIQ